MPRIRHTTLGGGGAVSDIPYGASWDGVTDVAPSKNAVYDKIQSIGYVPGNIAYQNIVGGDDSTAVLGNQLRPFKTIGAAITAIGMLTNAVIICSAGSNDIYDADCPQGLKVAGSTYDIFLEKGCTVNYYGTYGAWINGMTTGGNIYGTGIINVYSATATGVVDGKSGYSVNVAGAAAPYSNKQLNFERLVNYSAINFIRVGDCVTNNSNVSFISNGFSLVIAINAGSKDCITLDPNSKTTFVGFNNSGYLGNALAGSGLVVKINNPANATFDRCLIYSHGNQFGAAMPAAMDLSAEGSEYVNFVQSNFMFAGSAAGYNLVRIKNTTADYSNVLFDSTRFKSRASNAYPRAGYSLTADNNVTVKIIDTYAHQDINPAKSITNLIAAGNGFMVEPNL